MEPRDKLYFFSCLRHYKFGVIEIVVISILVVESPRRERRIVKNKICFGEYRDTKPFQCKVLTDLIVQVFTELKSINNLLDPVLHRVDKNLRPECDFDFQVFMYRSFFPISWPRVPRLQLSIIVISHGRSNTDAAFSWNLLDDRPRTGLCVAYGYLEPALDSLNGSLNQCQGCHYSVNVEVGCFEHQFKSRKMSQELYWWVCLLFTDFAVSWAHDWVSENVQETIYCELVVHSTCVAKICNSMLMPMLWEMSWKSVVEGSMN